MGAFLIAWAYFQGATEELLSGERLHSHVRIVGGQHIDEAV
jgi:hypothetical protein